MKSQNRIDKRKILLFLPILIIPILAFGFYALGGGQGNNEIQVESVGINTNLPDATFDKERSKDKLEHYDQFQIDSVANPSRSIEEVARNLGFNAQLEDKQTKEINSKLEALNKEINTPIESNYYRQSNPTTNNESASIKTDVDRLESLMKSMQDNKTEDPEMSQLNGLMQNILDIQHPERLKQKYKEQKAASPDSLFKAIPAIIAESKKMVQGATLKLILQDSIMINGIAIPKGHELYGACNIVNQRLLLDIKQIRLGTLIIPVDFSVYSLDGMIGINAPEAMLTDAVNSGTDNAVRDIGMLGYDQTIATQVAGAGIDAAKDLMSKRLRRVKVKLQGGYSILLRNNQLR